MARPTYQLRVNDTSPGRYGFGPDGGKATEVYTVRGSELLDAITDILGYTERNASGDGRLKRFLPKAHPLFWWMSATAISSIVGIGTNDADTGDTLALTAANEVDLEVTPIMDTYGLYPRYQITVEFAHRPYALLNDDSIYIETSSWTPVGSGSPATIDTPNEWTRYTEWRYTPELEVAYAQLGQMKFKTSGASPPEGYTFPGFPRIPIPKTGIEFIWYQVPLIYLEHANSPLVQQQGTVNAVDWYGWGKGMLLYKGPKVIRQYQPPVPKISPLFDTTVDAMEKFVDIALLFEETYKTSSDAPSDSNNKIRSQGHNLQPWLKDRAFHYVETQDGEPIYHSYPFQLLFMEPALLT